MKIDIQYYIRQVLREQRKVYIPEIGTLILSQSPASISDDKSVIHPPSINILFEDGASDDKALKTYIKDTGKYSKSDINAALSEYTQTTFDNLINSTVNHIEHIGVLSKVEGHDKVGFSPSVGLFTKEYKDLTPLPIHPINRIKQNSTVDHAINTEDQSLRTEGRWRWLQPIIAGIFIASLVILSMILMKRCNEPDSMLYNNPNVEIGEVNLENETADGFFEKASVNETTENTDISDDGTKIESESEKTDDLESKYEEVDQLVDEKFVAIESKIEEELNQLKLSENEVVEIEDVVEDLHEKALEEDNLKSIESLPSDPVEIVEPQSKYSNIIPASGQCVIVLASLKKATNITKMMSKIERDGKKLYTSQFNDMTRIGFVFDCTNVDLDVYLNEIRSKFATKAWYLDPSIAIPYQ